MQYFSEFRLLSKNNFSFNQVRQEVSKWRSPVLTVFLVWHPKSKPLSQQGQNKETNTNLAVSQFTYLLLSILFYLKMLTFVPHLVQFCTIKPVCIHVQ